MEKKVNELFVENPEKECCWNPLTPDKQLRKPVFQDELLKLSLDKTEFQSMVTRWHQDGHISLPNVSHSLSRSN